MKADYFDRFICYTSLIGVEELLIHPANKTGNKIFTLLDLSLGLSLFAVI